MKTRIPGIRKDGPDRFLVCVTWMDEKTGRKKKKEKVANSMEEALALKGGLRRVVEVQKPSRKRFADFAKEQIQVCRVRAAAGDLERSTLERYEIAAAHLIVFFGEMFLNAIMPSDVNQWRAQTATEFAAATVNGWLRLLRTMLEAAVDDGLIPRNPTRGVKALRQEKTEGKRGTALSPEQIGIFVEELWKVVAEKQIAEDVARHIEVLLWTGMRRGEAIALKWSDWREGELCVERSLWKGAAKPTKTREDRRVPVIARLEEILNAQRHWLLTTQHPGLESGLMFPAREKNVLGRATRLEKDELVWFRSSSVFDRPIAKVVEAGGLPAISPHSFRRSYENLLRMAGADELVRRSMAGWRTEEAQAIYAKVDPRERKAVADAAAKLVPLKKGDGVKK